MTELKLDLLLRIDYECDSDFVVRLLGHTPKSYYRKGAPTPWRHPRRYPWTLCEYEFVMDPACKSFSQFLISLFSARRVYLPLLSAYVTGRSGYFDMTFTLGHIDSDFSFAVEGEAHEILRDFRAGICFDTSAMTLDA